MIIKNDAINKYAIHLIGCQGTYEILVFFELEFEFELEKHHPQHDVITQQHQHVVRTNKTGKNKKFKMNHAPTKTSKKSAAE